MKTTEFKKLFGEVDKDHELGTLDTYRILGETSQAEIGAAMTYGSYGLAAPAGCALMAHGLDQYQTGMRTLFTGQYQTTATQQLLEKTGMPRNWASFTNDTISLVGSMGGTAIYRAGVRGSFLYRHQFLQHKIALKSLYC